MFIKENKLSQNDGYNQSFRNNSKVSEPNKDLENQKEPNFEAKQDESTSETKLEESNYETKQEESNSETKQVESNSGVKQEEGNLY